MNFNKVLRFVKKLCHNLSYKMQTDYISKNYKEHRGILVKKYRDFLGRYVFVIDENGVKSRVYVGKVLFNDTETDTKWTIGEIRRKLISIRPGICKNTDE